MSQPPSTIQQQRVVWWALWGAFQVGIFFIHHFVGMPQEPSSIKEPALWQLGLLPVLVSGAIRWSVLPMIKDMAKAFPLFIVGIALAEMSCFLGIFIFPSHQMLLFVASALGIFQFIPVYFGQFLGGPED